MSSLGTRPYFFEPGVTDEVPSAAALTSSASRRSNLVPTRMIGTPGAWCEISGYHLDLPQMEKIGLNGEFRWNWNSWYKYWIRSVNYEMWWIRSLNYSGPSFMWIGALNYVMWWVRALNHVMCWIRSLNCDVLWCDGMNKVLKFCYVM